MNWMAFLITALALTSLTLPGVAIWLLTDKYADHPKKVTVCFILSILCGASAFGLIAGAA